MDINDLRTLATVLVAVAFAGVSWWAFAPGRKGYFDEAAQLPFADEDNSEGLAQNREEQSDQTPGDNK